MQGIYRPTEVQSLAAPSRRRRPRVHPHAFRAPKSKLAVGLSIDLISLFVHSAMVAAARQHEV
jgi:hypothetical protein